MRNHYAFQKSNALAQPPLAPAEGVRYLLFQEAKMNFRNIDQATYDRICRNVRETWGRRVHAQDARDLLEAYEAAVTLLEQAASPVALASPALRTRIRDFLFMEPKRPGAPKLNRVVLDDGEPLSYSDVDIET